MAKSRSALLLLLPATLAFAVYDPAPTKPDVAVPAPASVAQDGEAALQFIVAPTGNEVRYRVREQLVGRDLPNDAVGETGAVTGMIVIDDAGQLVAEQSQIIVDVTGLTSDSDRRDGYVQRRLLEGEAHPTVTLTPTAISGLTGAVPTSGTAQLQVTGDLTVKGVTRPTTWQVTANFGADQVTGSAQTAFTFEEFELDQPRVPVLLSVADTIRLEYDFTLQRGDG